VQNLSGTEDGRRRRESATGREKRGGEREREREREGGFRNSDV